MNCKRFANMFKILSRQLLTVKWPRGRVRNLYCLKGIEITLMSLVSECRAKHPRSYIPEDRKFPNRKVGDDFVTSYIKSFAFCNNPKWNSIVRCHDDGRKTSFFSSFAVRKVEDPLSINCIAVSIFFYSSFLQWTS